MTITVDFETEAVDTRPVYPPRPVGVAIRENGRSTYLAWGHPCENNCTLEEARTKLRELWRNADRERLIFHNAKFELEVAERHFDLPIPDSRCWHDTMFLVYLADPHTESLGLKPAAQKILGSAPTERDALREWVLKNVPGVREKHWGAHISAAPGTLVGKYARADVRLTAGLFHALYPRIREQNMLAAYNREKQVMIHFLRNEQTGIRLDTARLKEDLRIRRADIQRAEAWLYEFFGAKFNLQSPEQLAKHLQRLNIVSRWSYTPTGKLSTSKKTLKFEDFSDPRIPRVLGYRTRLQQCLSTYGEPWLAQAEKNSGYIRTSWNQVRNAEHGDGGLGGTRTGRPSSYGPNFMNVAKSWDDKGDGYAHPESVGVAPLPLMRRYLLPDEGGVWCHRDYNQQELRLLAHFAEGQVLAAYQENPHMDIHTYVREHVARYRGVPVAEVPRRFIKFLNFGRIYGQGIKSLSERMGLSLPEAQALKEAQSVALGESVDRLEKVVKRLGRNGQAVRTWGGRVYHAEPPGYSKKYGRHMSYEYKLLNYLIQGSAADVTKEAIIRWAENPASKGARMLVTVYDEINISAPKGTELHHMRVLQEAMESIETDVAMLSDGDFGLNWSELQPENEYVP